ncbi:hypothetical protein [Nocardia sp. BMG51109]|uniref:hypothetical protein n=1 Tax=Nocardia sp. BMG51109 TaxID=1056816 RepID=UPI000467CEF6|nr:hypothetical protein [Nocardia sp. BMG51109]
MGDFRPYTDAELEQQERDQQDPKWLEWVQPERMNAQIDKFLNETVPDMPDNPWSAEGLDHAERAALAIFPDINATKKPENRDVADQFHRYIGEVFRRSFEGSWYNVPDSDDRGHGFEPAIRLPYTDIYSEVISNLTVAVHRKTGKEWSWIFDRNKESYAEWVQGGRLPLSQWIDAQEAR